MNQNRSPTLAPSAPPRSPLASVDVRSTFDDENTTTSIHVGATPLNEEVEGIDIEGANPRRSKQDMFQRYLAKQNLRKVRILLIIAAVVVLVILLVIVAYMLVPRILNYTVFRNLSCSFSAVMLGVGGGLTEENLSGVLISRGSNNRFIALDAGSLLYGIRRFIQGEGLTYTSIASTNSNLQFPFPSYASREVQRAGHAHLDHTAGLITNSPQDYFDGADGTPLEQRPTAKSLIGLSTTLSTIKDNVFNNKLWPNIPQLTNRYTYQTVQPLQGYSVNQLLAFPASSPYNDAFKDVSVKIFDICHSDMTSTAYLFTAASNSTEKQILYLSDTGAAISTGNNTCNWRAKLNTIWSDRALNVKQLTAIFIEVSSSDGTPDAQMFGHLRPADVMLALGDLKTATGVNDISNVKVIIQHIKPIFDSGDDPKEVIGKQVLQQAEKSGINAQFLFPSQGDYLCL